MNHLLLSALLLNETSPITFGLYLLGAGAGFVLLLVGAPLLAARRRTPRPDGRPPISGQEQVLWGILALLAAGLLYFLYLLVSLYLD